MNQRINPQPRTAMEAAWNKAVQKYATGKPKRPQPQPVQQQQGKKS